MALKMHPSLAVHVGDWLQSEIVEPAGASVTDLAAHFGVSRQALSTLLNGNASLSADMLNGYTWAEARTRFAVGVKPKGQSSLPRRL